MSIASVAMYHTRLESPDKPARHAYTLIGDPEAVEALAATLLAANPQATVELSEMTPRGAQRTVIVMGIEQ